MTEQEFRARYKQGFFAAYRSAVSADVDFGTVPEVKDLLAKAEEHATIAWKQYLKDTGRDTQD